MRRTFSESSADVRLKMETRILALLAIAVTVAACRGNKGHSDRLEQAPYRSLATGTATNTSTSQTTVSLIFPKGMSVESVGVAANGTLQLADRSVVLKADGSPGPVAAAGDNLSDIGVDTQLGSLTSVPSVFLRERATINGDLTTGGIRTNQNGTTVTGLITEGAVLTPLAVQSWNVDPPAANLGDVMLYRDTSATINPGAYGKLIAYSGSRLTLVSGVYHVTTFDLEPEAVLELNTSAGPVIVYVNGQVVFRGTQSDTTAQAGPFMLVELDPIDVYIEQAIAATVVVPGATLTLGAGGQKVMRGNFYAKNLTVRPDTTLIWAPFPWSTVFPPPTTCRAIGDYDRDGEPDCTDLCLYDPLKTKPGKCGCGVPDDDTDGDGTPDCKDQCPTDPTKTVIGQCGCKDLNPAPAGTHCSDTACPQPNAVCDGQGICGDVSLCVPGPDCRWLPNGTVQYWVCGAWSNLGKLSRSAAQQACANKGMKLLRVDTLDENSFIASSIEKPVWIGANDLSAAGSWRWTTPQTDAGEEFWAGAANGNRIGNMFVNWGKDAPGSGRCAAMNETDGRWSDVNCATDLGYVCEYEPPVVTWNPTGVPGVPGKTRPMTNCVPEATTGLPLPVDDSEAAKQAAQDTLKRQIAQADAGVFEGAAANPPKPGSVCPPVEPKSNALGSGPGAVGCVLTDQKGSPGQNNCVEDSDCATYNTTTATYVCREVPPSLNCDPQGISPSPCKAYTFCGILDCSSLSDDQQCDEIDICNPGSQFDAGQGPTTIPPPFTLDPNSIFPGGPADAGPSPTYVDDPSPPDAGTNHTWCRMRTQNPNSVPPAAMSSPPQQVNSGAGFVSLHFDPNLTFDINPNPLALGESAMSLHAAAGFGAHATLDGFMGMNKYEAWIIKAVAGITAKRCSIRTDETELLILGAHINLDDLGVPTINTEKAGDSTLAQATKACSDAIAQYQVIANRVKKAFRDAQQLLKQYYDAKNVGALLASNICDIFKSADIEVPGFPGGAQCYPNEKIESVINRFVEYYQAPGFGQVAQLVAGGDLLTKATSSLKTAIVKKFKNIGATEKKINLNFLDKSHKESQTIVNLPFAIGPVPCVLQIDLATSYGVAGNFSMELAFPANLFSGAGSKSRIAGVSASVVPHAAAALAAFVGAGVDYGAFSATIGLEGSVTLAEIRAPLFIGAGLDMEVTEDLRPIPKDLEPPISLAANAFQFGIPKAFRFSAGYNYGAGVDVKDVLTGDINVRLRIRFCFFSRTWRKRFVSFSGWSRHFDLVSGGGSVGVSSWGNSGPPVAGQANAGSTTTEAIGGSTMGRSESEVPLMQLAYLPVSDAPEDGPAQDITTGAVGKFFYDDMCCAKKDQTCTASGTPYPPCCANLNCVISPGATEGTCAAACREAGDKCGPGRDCCDGLICGGGGTCRVCAGGYQPCIRDSDCCRGFCDSQNGLCSFIGH